MSIKIIFKLISRIFFISKAGLSDWHYEQGNPNEWVDEYPQCGGVLQSPINVETAKAKFNPNLGPINFFNYDLNVYLNFTNNGHTSKRIISLRPQIKMKSVS